jgi:hypothetical protein
MSNPSRIPGTIEAIFTYTLFALCVMAIIVGIPLIVVCVAK